MALRADQWLMIGVGGLGAYALYRLLSTRPDQGGGEIPILQGNGQAPAETFAFPQNLIRGPTVRLTPGWYRGRIEVFPAGMGFPPRTPLPLDPITAMASREVIASDLRTLGFDPVTVYMTATEAESVIPLPALRQNPTALSRWFYGRWTKPASSTIAFPTALKALIPSEEPARPRTAGYYVRSPHWNRWQHG